MKEYAIKSHWSLDKVFSFFSHNNVDNMTYPCNTGTGGQLDSNSTANNKKIVKRKNQHKNSGTASSKLCLWTLSNVKYEHKYFGTHPVTSANVNKKNYSKIFLSMMISTILLFISFPKSKLWDLMHFLPSN